MLLSGELNAHLEEIDRAAEEMFFQLMEQMTEREDVTEKLNVENQMKWVRRMNAIRTAAEEVVRSELIYC